MNIWARIRNRWRRREGCEQGQSLVESALMLPLLVTMLIGVVDLGQVVYMSITVENSAKAGAQYGCQNGFTAQDTTGIQTAASDEATGMTVTATSSYSCACSDGTASTCLNTDCANSHIEQTLTVNTTATVTPIIHLPLLPTSFTMTGQAIQRVDQ